MIIMALCQANKDESKPVQVVLYSFRKRTCNLENYYMFVLRCDFFSNLCSPELWFIYDSVINLFELSIVENRIVEYRV